MLIKRINFHLKRILNNDLKQQLILSRCLCKAIKENSKSIKSTKKQLDNENLINNQQFEMPKILNVAEKNDAAKNIARIMSNGTSRMRNSYSKFNKIYEFQSNLPRFGQSQLSFYSVAGHLLDKDFEEQYRKWYSCDPVDLFHLPVLSFVPPNFKDIARSLESEAKKCSVLIIWTDCDREGQYLNNLFYLYSKLELINFKQVKTLALKLSKYV